MRSRLFAVGLVALAMQIVVTAAMADDLKISKKIAIGSTSLAAETYVKGDRERNVMSMPGGTSSVTIHQCDLKRTLTVSDQTQTYLISPDPETDDVADAAALLTGAPAAQSGGKITLTTTVTDTGERKPMFGYTARHLKTTVLAESSENACSAVHQKIEIDGWYADVAKNASGCVRMTAPIRQGESCHDKLVLHAKGKGKPGFPLIENISIQNQDSQPTAMKVEVADISKQTLSADLFDAPSGFRQVNTAAELYGMPQAPQAMQAAQAAAPSPMPQSAPGNPYATNPYAANPYAAATAGGNPMAMNPAMYAQAAAMGMRPGAGIPGMPGAAPAGGAPVAAPQVLGPKAPGKIRIGVMSPDAQVGQGSSSGMDYGTPIRNAMIAYMNGPAVEVAALDSHIAMQVEAEAQQKQCDYILYSSVMVKHGSGGGFGKFMKMAGPASSVVPMAGAMKGMGAAAAAGAMTSTVAQTAAMNSLANFNGQIKQKDEVTLAYHLAAPGQSNNKLSDTLKGKATSDGQDVLSPLIQQLANNVLTAAAKK